MHTLSEMDTARGHSSPGLGGIVVSAVYRVVPGLSVSLASGGSPVTCFV